MRVNGGKEWQVKREKDDRMNRGKSWEAGGREGEPERPAG